MEIATNIQPRKKGIMETLSSQKGYLYLLPALIFLAVFTIYPIFNTVLSALKNNYQGLSGNYDGFGFENFVKVWNSPDFERMLINTLLFAFVSVPISTLLALFISVWLNSIKWLQKAYQTIFFLPYLTNALAIGAVFAAMFNMTTGGSPGLANIVLGWFGIDPINFINPGSSLFWNRMVVIIYSIWVALPFKILIIFSALQSVNKQYYDAAKIDGASPRRTLWKVTVPLISPMLSYLLITGFIAGFKEYTAVVGIFGPEMGPINGEMNTVVGYIYEKLRMGQTGFASAGALILLVIIMFFTFINLWISKRKVHY